MAAASHAAAMPPSRPSTRLAIEPLGVVAKTATHPWPKADVGQKTARAAQIRKKMTSTAESAQPAATLFRPACGVSRVVMMRSPFPGHPNRIDAVVLIEMPHRALK